MATNEIITISSDEESGSVNGSELIRIGPFSKSGNNHNKLTQTVRKSHDYGYGYSYGFKKATSFHSSKSMQANIQRNFYELYHKPQKKDDIFIIDEKRNKRMIKIGGVPEVVDLEDCNNITEITLNNSDDKPNSEADSVENHSQVKLIELNGNEAVTTEQSLGIRQSDLPNTYDHVISYKEETKGNSSAVKKTSDIEDNDRPKIPEFFNKFVELCSSFESNKSDRARLIKKLLKRCNGADPKYVKSQEFRALIDKSKEKITKNNLYLIAKEVTDELTLRKKIQIKNMQSDEEVANEKAEVILKEEKRSKKKTKMINKIIKKLDKLGEKIRELEEAEVDLSDEEDSSYILVQRYRERFCQIYKKLCEVMKEPSDANRVLCRKICFSGTKYPAINQCIERWLNKTKRFPDFNDIVKLLESQSSSLGLSSNKELIRATATEIFQEVGKMLQRRRKHDLWDSLCGFLNDEKDPALADPDLDKVLRNNFDTRVKKEQEIFRHYAELQEKERLEPEEVPEDEANLSPIESGNEDEEEIEGIEKSLNERLDVTIEREHNLAETDYNSDGGEKNVTEGGESLTSDNKPTTSVKEAETPTQVKESKNNYKNCKSIKYRSENRSKSNDDISSCKNGFEETSEKGEDKNLNETIEDTAPEMKEDEKGMDTSSEGEIVLDKESSDVDIVSSESNEVETESSELDKFDFSKIPIVKVMRLPDDLDLGDIEMSEKAWMSPKSEKRELMSENESPDSVKRRRMDSPALEIDFKNDVEEVFEVHRCQIEHDYVEDRFDFLDDLTEKRKHWDKGKVFRDLTNVGRLMEFKGRKRKSSEYFSHSIYHPGFPEFPKFSWKKRFRLNYKFVGLKNQKCALSQDDKDSKSVGGDGKDSDGKGVENNSESGGDDGSNFFIGGGSGSEKDNDENDENKRSEKTKDFSDDAKHDEDEEDEEDEEETEDEMGGKDGKKPEEETALENSFNCSTDDQVSSFNESNASLEMITNPTAAVENEEDEREEDGVEDRSECDFNMKGDENGDNIAEVGADEVEGNVGDESMSPRDSEKDGSEESYKEPQGPEEDEMNTDKVDDNDQIEGENTEIGQTDVEEKEEDAETGEEDAKQNDTGTGGQQEEGLDIEFTETQNEDDAETGEEDGKQEDTETGGQQEESLDMEFTETQNEDDAETGEEDGKQEDTETGGQQEEGLDMEFTETQNEDDAEIIEKDAETEGRQEADPNIEYTETENKDDKEIREEEDKEKDAEAKEQQETDLNIEYTETENKDNAEIREEKAETQGPPETSLNVEFAERQNVEETLETREVQGKEEEKEGGEGKEEEKERIEGKEEEGEKGEIKEEEKEDNRSKESIEQKEAMSSSQEVKPLIRLRSLAEMEAMIESRFDSRMIPRMDPRIEPRMSMGLEQRFGLRMEPMVDMRLQQVVEQRIEPRAGLRMEPRIDPRMDPRVDPRPGLRLEPRGGLRLEPRAGLRLEPRAGLRLEPRAGLRLEPRTGLRLEPRTGLRAEPRAGLRVEPRTMPGVEQRAGLRVEPRAGPGVEHRAGMGLEQRIDTRMEQRFERSPLGCKNKRENVVRREICQGPPANQTNQTVQTIPTIQTGQRKLSTREESSYHGNQESEIEFLGQKIGKRKKTPRSPTDEERVKKFLMHSPSSISIIPPKKLTLSKPPSQAALQALETLKGLKGISATRVRSRESRPEDEVVVIGESYTRRQTARKSTGGVKRRNDLPVISSVHSIQSQSATGSPKIQAFQGSVSGFQGSSQPMTTAPVSAATVAAAAGAASPATNNRMKNGPPAQPGPNDSSSIRISSVWGSIPQTAVYGRSMSIPGNSESPLPGCSFQNDSSSAGGGGEGGTPGAKKKKKPVEFVVLE